MTKKQRDENPAPALEKSGGAQQPQKGTLQKSKTQKASVDPPSSQKPTKPTDSKAAAEKRHSAMEPGSSLTE